MKRLLLIGSAACALTLARPFRPWHLRWPLTSPTLVLTTST